MEIEGFGEIIGMISLAKELYDIGRYDLVEENFTDTLCYDTWLENMWSVITSVFSGFEADYEDDEEAEKMVFTDEVISDFYTYAREFGQKTYTPHGDNLYIKEAEFEARRWLSFTYNMDYQLLGSTESLQAARESKLIIYTSATEFCEYDHLAFGLVRLYKWFSDKCAEFRELTERTGFVQLTLFDQMEVKAA